MTEQPERITPQDDRVRREMLLSMAASFSAEASFAFSHHDMAELMRHLAERIDPSRSDDAEAERDRMRDAIAGAGVKIWDRAEISERDEAGNQTLLLWHPTGYPLATLGIQSHDQNITAWMRDMLIGDLLDLFCARAVIAEETPADRGTPTR